MAVFRAVQILNFAIIGLIVVKAEEPHKRFEYKYSFKGPYLAQKDGTVPFWEYDGNAIASDDMVRITPSVRSKKGSIWTKVKSNFYWWEVELVFRVNGRGRLGADGLAFWFTDEKGKEGPVFGSVDKWQGLGVLFDSFDNDGRGNNPYIMAITNDGTKAYDHQTDGINQQLAGCLRDFRNKPFPVRAKIEYYKNVLQILFHSGNTNNDDEYEMCLRAENVHLPQFGYFGVSAATGGLADDHDVLKFLTSSLHPPGTQPTQMIAEAEKEKFSKEYEQYKEKLEKQKEEFRKSHPEEAKKKDMEMHPDEEYESQQQRELQQIFHGQSQMFEVLRGLHRKLDEIVGRQERALSMLSAVQIGGGAPVPQGQAHHQPVPAGSGDTIRRHEVEALLGNQRDVIQAAREIKSFVSEIHQRTGQGSGGGSAGSSFESQNFMNEMRESLNVVKRDVSSISSRSTGGGPCPTLPNVNCLSTSYFFIFMILQLVFLVGYMMYRSTKDAQAKKFY